MPSTTARERISGTDKTFREFHAIVGLQSLFIDEILLAKQNRELNDKKER